MPSKGLYFDRIDIGDVHYMDGDATSHRRDSLEASQKITDEVNRRYDYMRGESGVEPGCETMRESVALRDHKMSGGEEDFVKWRRAREAARKCLDPQTDTHLTMVARTSEGPIGAVLLYSIEFLGVRPDGVSEFDAYCGPFVENPEHSFDFMLYMLDNEVTGYNERNEPTTFQLVKWKFPVNDTRNRWLTSRPQAQRWVPKFSAEGYDLKLSSRTTVEFAKSLELSAGPP